MRPADGAPAAVQRRTSGAPVGTVQLKSGRAIQRLPSGQAVQRSENPDGPPPANTVAPATSETTPETNVATPNPEEEKNARKQELQASAEPIEQAEDEEAATLNAEGTAINSFKSDSPDPILLKDNLIGLTRDYLNLTAADGQRKTDLLAEIKRVFGLLKTAMKRARGEHRVLVQRRVKFEKLLGEKAEGWSQTTECLNTMSATAKEMIAAEESKAAVDADQVDQTLVALPDEVKKRVGKALGSPTNIGFAGTVGTSFAAIKQVLDDGTITQRCVTLANFADKYLIPNLLTDGSQVMKIVLQKLQGETEQLALAKAIDDANKEPDEKKKRAILLTTAKFREKILAAEQQAPSVNAERTEEKRALTGNANAALEQGATVKGMDTKQVGQPIEVCTIEQLDFVAGSINPQGFPKFNRAEYQTKRLKADKIAYLISCDIRTTRPSYVEEGKTKEAAVDATSIVGGGTGITQDRSGGAVETQGAVDSEKLTLTQAEIDAAAEENFNYIEGKLENIVDPKNAWIKDANEAQAPLKAGISGTTARFVGTARLLGGSVDGAVTAMLGHLQKIEAHSFWEIVDAAGIGAGAGKYVPFSPNEAGLRSAADEFVTSETQIQLGTEDKAKALRKLLGEEATA